MEVTLDFAKYVTSLIELKTKAADLDETDRKWRTEIEVAFPALVRVRHDAEFERWFDAQVELDSRVRNMRENIDMLPMASPSPELVAKMQKRLEDARAESRADLEKMRTQLRRKWRTTKQ